MHARNVLEDQRDPAVGFVAHRQQLGPQRIRAQVREDQRFVPEQLRRHRVELGAHRLDERVPARGGHHPGRASRRHPTDLLERGDDRGPEYLVDPSADTVRRLVVPLADTDRARCGAGHDQPRRLASQAQVASEYHRECTRRYGEEFGTGWSRRSR